MRPPILILSFFTLVVLAGCASPARAGGGHFLGTVRLADAKDRDVVRLGPCRGGANRFAQQIRLEVSRHRAEIDRVRVAFHNGREQELHVKQHFGVGDSSRWIDLDGDRRCIARIGIVGDTDSLGFRPGKQARVSFYGR